MHYPMAAHLKVQRFGYTHHGIYVGGNDVVHYSGKANGLFDRSGKIAKVSLADFANGTQIQVVRHAITVFTPIEAVARALRRIGEVAYTVFENNCEHFVNWCLHDQHRSRQVDAATIGVNATVATTVAAGTRAAIAGRSGASIMQVLKSTGQVVGGGALRGINVIGGAGSIATDLIMSHTVLKHNDALGEAENKARRNGRWAGRAAGVGSTAMAGSVVTAMAAPSAVGGAAITSGLAAIGGTVGGGMVAGAAITVAAPAALTAAVGYGIYKLCQ